MITAKIYTATHGSCIKLHSSAWSCTVSFSVPATHYIARKVGQPRGLGQALPFLWCWMSCSVIQPGLSSVICKCQNAFIFSSEREFKPPIVGSVVFFLPPYLRLGGESFEKKVEDSMHSWANFPGTAFSSK